MADASNREEWKKIAEAITQETDSKRLIELVEKLVDTLGPSKPTKEQSAAD